MADDIVKEFLVESSENLAVSIAEKANHTVSKLGSSSAESGEVIKVITSVAQQMAGELKDLTAKFCY